MLLPETDADGAMGVARRVLNAIDACAIPHPASAAAPHVTISIGVAVMVPEGKRPQILIDAADAALYEAKGRGRHQIVLAP
jgi:diguanylate cyclase (GGDEF)-like protein